MSSTQRRPPRMDFACHRAPTEMQASRTRHRNAGERQSCLKSQENTRRMSPHAPSPFAFVPHPCFRQRHDLPFSEVTLARLTYSQSCSSMIHRICSDFSRSLPFYKVACLLRPPISKRITLLHRRRWHFATPPRPIYRLV